MRKYAFIILATIEASFCYAILNSFRLDSDGKLQVIFNGVTAST